MIGGGTAAELGRSRGKRPRITEDLEPASKRSWGKPAADAPVLTQVRHAGAIRTALGEVENFAEALSSGIGPEVAAAHLRPAESALEELLGVITPDDIPDRVVAQFCVGK